MPEGRFYLAPVRADPASDSNMQPLFVECLIFVCGAIFSAAFHIFWARASALFLCHIPFPRLPLLEIRSTAQDTLNRICPEVLPSLGNIERDLVSLECLPESLQFFAGGSFDVALRSLGRLFRSSHTARAFSCASSLDDDPKQSPSSRRTYPGVQSRLRQSPQVSAGLDFVGIDGTDMGDVWVVPQPPSQMQYCCLFRSPADRLLPTLRLKPSPQTVRGHAVKISTRSDHFIGKFQIGPDSSIQIQ